MPFEVRQEKNYQQPVQDVYNAALKAVNGLEGELLKQSSEKGALEAKFDKKILGHVLGDRTQMTALVSASADGAMIAVEAYPIDAVGRKLLFGARKGVTSTVVSWFFAHLEHHLGLS